MTIRKRVSVCTTITVLSFSSLLNAFTASKDDPWYFANDKMGLQWTVPDKYLHGTGSQLMCELGHQLIPSNYISPITSILFGYSWEVKDRTRGDIFSVRDLKADILGVLFVELRRYTNNKLVGYQSFNKRDKIILWHIAYRF